MSSSKTTRKSGAAKFVKIGVALAAVGTVGAGAWFAFFRDSKQGTSEGAALLGLGSTSADGKPSRGYDSASGLSVGPGAPVINVDIDGTLAAARNLLAGKSGQERHTALISAHRSIAAMLEQPLPVSMRLRVLPDFHAICDELFFSNVRNELSDNYIVQSGDSIARIAKRHGVTEELICLWNNIVWEKRANIHVGDSFKIVKGKPNVIVDKSDFCLSFYFGDMLAHQFIIAHGKGNNTPEGQSTIASKTIDPDKQPGAGPRQQEMAARWMGLANYAGRTGIGIHGTKEEDSIPGETSHGCVRMYNAQVTELYKWLPLGATVVVRA